MRALLLFSVVLIYGSLAYAQNEAGLITEPYAGYFTGDVSLEGQSPDGDIRSYSAGARLGFRFENNFAVGIDYAQGQGKVDFKTGTKYNLETKDGGVFVGYYFPAYIKVWTTYILRHEALIKDYPTAGGDYDAMGEGYNVGITIRGIPFVSINLTHSIRELKEANNVDLVGSNKVTTTLLSVSLPYNFPWKP